MIFPSNISKLTKIVMGIVACAVLMVIAYPRLSTPVEAQSSGRLICMPVDDNGNITNDKKTYSRMVVKNETNRDIQIVLQRNLCDYDGGAINECKQFVEAEPFIMRAGQTQIFPSAETRQWFPDNWVSCQSVGQLDIHVDRDYYDRIGADQNSIPSCFNTADNNIWDGGIAYTISANPTACCPPEMNLEVSPQSPQTNQEMTITASNPTALVCTDVTQSGLTGLVGGNAVYQNNKFVWQWTARASNEVGQHSLIFTGNTKDGGEALGSCPNRAIGDWCETSTTFNIAPQAGPQCNNIQMYVNDQVVQASQRDQIEVGQTIKFSCSSNNYNPSTDHYEFRMMVNGQERGLLARDDQRNYSQDYMIPTGQYGSYNAQCRVCRGYECEDWEAI